MFAVVRSAIGNRLVSQGGGGGGVRSSGCFLGHAVPAGDLGKSSVCCDWPPLRLRVKSVYICGTRQHAIGIGGKLLNGDLQGVGGSGVGLR